MSDGAPAPDAYRTVEVAPGVHQFRSLTRGCNVYLIVGRDRIALVDTGFERSYPELERRLGELGYRVGDIDLVLLTHEHFDHVAACARFAGTAVTVAHRLAANRIVLDDDFATAKTVSGEHPAPFRVDLWLEGGNIIDLPPFRLEVLHTPGHTSGCICYYDHLTRLLFCGDTVMAGGVMGGIFSSGNIGDYINSLERLSYLRVGSILPGHGRVSETGEADIEVALGRSVKLLGDTRDLFGALGAGTGWQRILTSVRDLNR